MLISLHGQVKLSDPGSPPQTLQSLQTRDNLNSTSDPILYSTPFFSSFSSSPTALPASPHSSTDQIPTAATQKTAIMPGIRKSTCYSPYHPLHKYPQLLHTASPSPPPPGSQYRGTHDPPFPPLSGCQRRRMLPEALSVVEHEVRPRLEPACHLSVTCGHLRGPP